MPATATLTILTPGPTADAILTQVSRVISARVRDDGAYDLTFQHASPTNAEAVLSTALCTAGFKDWRGFISLDVDGLPRWPPRADRDLDAGEPR